MLNSQASRHALISYLRWQQQVEHPLLEQVNALPSQGVDQFVVQTPESLRAVESNEWVVLLRQGTRLSPWALRAVGQRLQSISPTIFPMIIYGDEDSISSDFNPDQASLEP